MWTGKGVLVGEFTGISVAVAVFTGVDVLAGVADEDGVLATDVDVAPPPSPPPPPPPPPPGIYVTIGSAAVSGIVAYPYSGIGITNEFRKYRATSKPDGS